MNIPHNSLMEQIKELVCLCEQIASDYGDDASWFKQPASDEMISNWENKHNVFIPETYKEWLSFTNEAQIRNSLAHFYGPDKFVMNSGDLPEDLIVIADLIGDGEQLCFSKITRNFVWVDHGELEIIDDFGAVLSEIIRMLKPKSCLSPEMKELLMNMVKNNSQDKKRNNDKERNNRCF